MIVELNHSLVDGSVIRALVADRLEIGFCTQLRCVQRPQEALDALVGRLVRNGEFSVELLNARALPDIHVDGEIPLPERDCRVFKDCAGIIVERLIAILTSRWQSDHCVSPNLH